MTPETDILIPAVLPLKDRCSLNFHFWPPGPWDPCYFHLRESVFSRSLPVSCSSPSLSTACRESKRESNTQDCSYSINCSDCTSSLVTFRLLADAQPLPPLSYSKFHSITLICRRKNISWNLYSSSAKRTPFYTDPVIHTNQSLLWKSSWECLPYYYLCVLDTDFLPWLNISSLWHPDQ